jgi:hypothetical protein
MIKYESRVILIAVAVVVLTSLGLATRFAAANLAGTWLFSVDLDGGGHGDPTFVFKQDGDKLTGTYDGPLGHQDVTGTVTGNKAVFGFQASQDGETVKLTYTGTIESQTKMSGTIEFSTGEKGKWTATKK